MPVKYNPFKPGSIVHPGMFAGREAELHTLDRALFQTLNGNAAHFLIHGERGIGKSSLLYVINCIARGEVKSLNDVTYSYLTVNVELEPSDSYGDIVRKIARELQRELDRDQAIRKRLADLWEFVTKWKVMGVEYKREATPIDAMLEELAEKLVVVSQALKEENRGIYILIDEADKPPTESNLGELVKVLTERLTKRNAGNVGVGLSGISSVIKKLKDSHESSIRVLTPVALNTLDIDDRKAVVRRGLSEANKRNLETTTISEDALELIADQSEGYPYFIQQYAYSAFEQDSDNTITRDDVMTALSKENGALHLLGVRYFEDMYSEEIKSDDYRKVLQVLAMHAPNYVAMKQIIAESGLKRHTVNNALSALKRHGSVIARKGHLGQYRLPSRSFAVWILAFKKAVA